MLMLMLTLQFMTNPPTMRRNLLPTSITIPSRPLARLTPPLIPAGAQVLRTQTQALTLLPPHLTLQEAITLAPIMSMLILLSPATITGTITTLKAVGHHLHHQAKVKAKANLLVLQAHHPAQVQAKALVLALVMVPTLIFGAHHLPLHIFQHQLQALAQPLLPHLLPLNHLLLTMALHHHPQLLLGHLHLPMWQLALLKLLKAKKSKVF